MVQYSTGVLTRGYVKKFCQVEEVAEVKEADSGPSCTTKNLNVCSADYLCKIVTYKDFGFQELKWWSVADSNGSQRKFIKEAKNRGLTCGVAEIISTNIKQAFITQPKLKRQQLQYALKKLGYYSYGVDGLWGKGTASGFDKFVNGNGLKSKTGTQVFSNLLSRVTVPTAFSAPELNSGIKYKPALNDNQVLCRFATTSHGKWSRAHIFEPYVKEAKKRGLTCGVK